MQRTDVTHSPRLAGQVARYHTWPVLRRQSTGEHTWQVMRIYWQLFGPMEPEVSTALLWHDAGELAVGDLPFPVKASHPDLKAVMDGLESDAVAAMAGPAAHLDLGEARIRIKVCDLLEMYEFGMQEIALGNAYALPIVNDTLAACRELLPRLPEDQIAGVEAYVAGTRRRIGCT